MKKILILAISLMACSLFAETIKIPGGGNISFDIPKGWKKSDFAARGAMKTITLTQNDSVIKMAVFPDKKAFTSQDKIVDHLKRLFTKAFAKNTLETKPNLKSLKTDYMFGSYATYTDKKLVGKKGKKGDWKYMTNGLFHIKDYSIVFSLLTNDSSPRIRNEAVEIIKSLR